MPSFDVVSELDKHEVTNAVENAVKELDRRYDLKGKGSFEFKEKELTVNLTAEADFQLEAMIEILKLALVKRKIDVQCLEVKDAYASGKLMKQEAVLKEGQRNPRQRRCGRPTSERSERRRQCSRGRVSGRRSGCVHGVFSLRCSGNSLSSSARSRSATVTPCVKADTLMRERMAGVMSRVRRAV